MRALRPGARGRARVARLARPAPGAVAQPRGWVVRGPNFYVWQEDERDALDWARELDGLQAPRRGPHRKR